MELVHEMTYHAMLRPPMPVGDGPFGTRMFLDVIEGNVEGPRIRGKFAGSGGDWLLIGPDGFGRLDVRAQIRLNSRPTWASLYEHLYTCRLNPPY